VYVCLLVIFVSCPMLLLTWNLTLPSYILFSHMYTSDTNKGRNSEGQLSQGRGETRLRPSHNAEAPSIFGI